MQRGLSCYVMYVSMMFTLCICVANIVLYLEREQMQHGLCLPSCRLSSEHTTRLRGNSRIGKGRPEGTGARPSRPRSNIGARSGGCLSQKTSALHPGHEQHEERGAAVANEVRGTILRVKYHHSQNGSFRSHQIHESQ